MMIGPIELSAKCAQVLKSDHVKIPPWASCPQININDTALHL